MKLTTESRPAQVVLPPEVKDRVELDFRLRDRLDRTLSFWGQQLHSWEADQATTDGLQLYSLSQSSDRRGDVVLTIRPRPKQAYSDGYSPNLNGWTDQTVLVEYGVFAEGDVSVDTYALNVDPESPQPSSHPEIAVSVIDANGNPDVIAPHQRNVAKVLTLLEDDGNTIPITRLAATVGIRKENQRGHNTNVETLLEPVRWDGLPKEDRNRLINRRVKAIKKLSKRPILRWQTMNEMKSRFLHERSGTSLQMHPINQALFRGLTPSVYFDLFYDELYSGKFPKNWLASQLQTITKQVARMEQQRLTLIMDLLKLGGVATIYLATNGGEIFQDARFNYLADTFMLLYGAQKLISLMDRITSYPEYLDDYKNAAERLADYLGNQ